MRITSEIARAIYKLFFFLVRVLDRLRGPAKIVLAMAEKVIWPHGRIRGHVNVNIAPTRLPQQALFINGERIETP